MDNQMPRESSAGKSIKKLIRKIEKTEAKLKSAADSEDRKKTNKELDDFKAQLAWQYLEAREFEKAAGIYDKLPEDTHIRDRYCGKARILIETQKYDEARKLLEEALEKLPDYVPVLNTLGILYNVTADYYEALRYFDRAHALDTQNNFSPLYNKVFALRSLGYYEEERKLLVKLLESDPDNSNFNAELAYCEGQRGNYPETVKGCKKLLENGYETPLLYTWLCKAYINLGCMHELFAAALDGIGKFPDQEADLYAFLGMGHMELEQLDEAKKAFQQGLELNPASEVFPDLIELVEKILKQKNAKKQRKKVSSDNFRQGGLS